MRKLGITEATASLAEYTRELNHGPLVVTAHGKPIAALVPIEGVDWETLCVGTSPKFLDLIERSRRREAEEGVISSEEMHRRLGMRQALEEKSKSNNQKPNAAKRVKKK